MPDGSDVLELTLPPESKKLVRTKTVKKPITRHVKDEKTGEYKDVEDVVDTVVAKLVVLVVNAEREVIAKEGDVPEEWLEED
jgi:hypothetical protein